MAVAEIDEVQVVRESEIPLGMELVGTVTIKNSPTFARALRLDIMAEGADKPDSSLRFFPEDIRPGEDFQSHVDRFLLDERYYLMGARYTPRGPLGIYPEQVSGVLYRLS